MESLVEASKLMNNLPPDTNTYLPMSGGTESLANLIYCVNDPDMKVFAGHWYMPQAREFGEAMRWYSEAQAEFFGVPFGWDSSSIPVGAGGVVSPIITAMSSFMTNILTFSQYPWRWFIVSGSAEDDMRWRLQMREYRKIMANYMSDCLDSSGVSIEALVKTPEIRNPMEFMTKAELIALIMRYAPEAVNLIWTCPNPQGKIKVDGEMKGYAACGKCFKCMEQANAKKLAADAVFRYQEGKEYYSRTWREYCRTVRS
jgi:hypothetical protein